MPTNLKNAIAAPKTETVDFIDFGCGRGGSMSFAHNLTSGIGYGIDVSKEAVAACNLKGFDARHGNIIEFKQKNAAAATITIDVFPEMSNYTNFATAFLRITEACRNFSLIQHQYFDEDSRLAINGKFIKENFAKRIQIKPSVADYIYLTHQHGKALNICGLAIFALGEITPSSLYGSVTNETVLSVPKSLRVIVGRKDVSRFRSALAKVGAGKSLYFWEQD